LAHDTFLISHISRSTEFGENGTGRIDTRATTPLQQNLIHLLSNTK
jgi:hypothetical protein